jgi:hypothetical protein
MDLMERIGGNNGHFREHIGANLLYMGSVLECNAKLVVESKTELKEISIERGRLKGI